MWCDQLPFQICLFFVLLLLLLSMSESREESKLCWMCDSSRGFQIVQVLSTDPDNRRAKIIPQQLRSNKQVKISSFLVTAPFTALFFSLHFIDIRESELTFANSY
jgi:hypothetical protein